MVVLVVTLLPRFAKVFGMSGDGSVGSNFVANAAIVSLCSLVNIMEKKQERKS